MRNLTIQRAKSFVACLIKMQVYLEDSASGDTVINEVPCRRLGDLKNGETKTFSVGEQECRVFVTAGAASKNYCNDVYRLPAGQDDITLTGKNRYNPANGNAFRFDGNENEEVRLHRKKNTKRGLIIFLAALLVGTAIGILNGSGFFARLTRTQKDFSSNGIQITLTSDFEKVVLDSFLCAYSSEEVAVFVQKEEFSLLDGMEELTEEQYAELAIKNNKLSSSGATQADGPVYFTYSTDTESGSFTYFAYVYKTNDAFWLVQFAVPATRAESYEAQIGKWAKTVSFAE